MRTSIRLTLLCGGLLASLGSAADITHTNGTIRFSGNDFILSFSDINGSLLSVTPANHNGSLFSSGELGLWSASFKEGGSLNATAFAANSPGNRFNWSSDSTGTILRLNYTNAQIAMSVGISERNDGVDFQAQVTPAQKTILELSLPARLRWQPDNLRRLVCPLNANESVGAVFKTAFFKSQPESNPAGWQTFSKGPAAYTSLFGGPLISRPDNDPAVPINITTNGRAWFGTNVAARWDKTNAFVNRPSTTNQLDLVLADSANGPFFGASHLGGKGYLFRMGGNVAEAQQPLALDLALAAMEHLALSAPVGRTNIALISLIHGPTSGGWASVTVNQWRDRLRASSVLRSHQVQVVEIPNAQALLEAQSNTNYLAILNPYGEWTPVLEQGGMTQMVSAIRNYVRAGGNWFEVGGYSFYYELRPTHYLNYSTPYPPAFADILHFETVAGNAALFGVQPQQWQPWAGANNPAAIFVPGRLAWGADAQGAYSERAFGTFVNPGQTWQSPIVRLILGYAAPDSLSEYCRANQFSRRLEDKMSPSLLDRFKKSVLVNYEGNCAAKLANLDQLPTPALVHFADYLMGGFDKQYPDHLPPNPSFGTPSEFSAFLQRCSQLGLLVMPYSNPTWWCDHPRGPTFTREGETPLLKKFDGSLAYELYGVNDGYTVCHWHPAVRAANQVTLQQFITNYPMDFLFQDQCGARTWQYDSNPASPTPYAYADGLVSMVAEDSRTKPLATENGWDRIVNYESELCGMTWALVPTENAPDWRTFMNDRLPPATWDIFPLAQYIAHDKTAMTHHDLGQFVTDDATLSWTMALGYSLSYRTAATDLSQRPGREWMLWLDRLQKSVCARYVGQPVVSFAQVRGTNLTAEPDGIVQATYGPVRIVANLTPSAKAPEGIQLAPFGYSITAPGLIAANLNPPSGGTNQSSVSFVVEDNPGKAELWIYSSGERDVSIQLPRNLDGTARVAWDGGATNSVPVRNGVMTLNLGFKPDLGRIQPPAELAGKAPRDWPDPKPAIGILNLPSMPQSWTSITPTDWVQAFTNSSLATMYGVPIRRITTVNDMMNALQAGPTVWLAIINPNGEMFPSTAAGLSTATLSAIRDYVNRGGSWWETAGYSFYNASFLQSGTWKTEAIGPNGMKYFGLPVGGGDVAQAAEPLTITALGQTVFGESLSLRLQGLTSIINRGLLRTSDDPGHLALLAGAQQDFLGAYRLDGWGCLWRIGGFWPNSKVVLPAAVATMEYLYTHPSPPFPPGAIKYLWHANLMVDSRPAIKQSAATNGLFSFTIANCPTGATNYVERSVDVAGKAGWQDVFIFLSPEVETNWTDPESAAAANSFYRVKSTIGN